MEKIQENEKQKVKRQINSIDFGLTVCWADRNFDADTENDAGHLVSWGCSYKNEKEIPKRLNQNDFDLVVSGFSDIVNEEYGDGWRMPTKDEFNELIRECNPKEITRNGVEGILFEKNGRTLFLPKTGFKSHLAFQDGIEYQGVLYWTSDYDLNVGSPYCLTSIKEIVKPSDYAWHVRGAIRPVRPKH